MPESGGEDSLNAKKLSNPVSSAMVDYYKLLKVSPKATTAEIKSAYRRLARKLHPDVNKDSEKATKDFAVIAKAYEILSDPQERAFYDRQLRKAQANQSVHTSGDSVIHSNNPHARRLRQMAIERRYNEIIDRMMDAERDETLALQKVIFPTVALFVSTFFVAIFKPLLWTNSQVIGKIVLLTLFIIGVLHLVKRLRSGFQRYTYDAESVHDSILDENEPEVKPYTRFTAAVFLIGGIGISLIVGLIIGNYLEAFMTSPMPKFFFADAAAGVYFLSPNRRFAGRFNALIYP